MGATNISTVRDFRNKFFEKDGYYISKINYKTGLIENENVIVGLEVIYKNFDSEDDEEFTRAVVK